MNNSIFKGMLIVMVFLYILSPVDLAPGPVDDVIVLLLGLAAKKKLSAREEVVV